MATGDLVYTLVKNFLMRTQGIVISNYWEVNSGGTFFTHGRLELLPGNCFELPPKIYGDLSAREVGRMANDNEEFAHINVAMTEVPGQYRMELQRMLYDDETGDYRYVEPLCCIINIDV